MLLAISITEPRVGRAHSKSIHLLPPRPTNATAAAAAGRGERERSPQFPAPIPMARCCTFLEILLAILLPPLGVFLHFGCCSMEFCICLLLTILGYIPGIIYAVYVLVALDSEERQREYYTLA